MKRIYIIIILLPILVFNLTSCRSDNTATYNDNVIYNINPKFVDSVNTFDAIPYIFDNNVVSTVFFEKDEIIDFDKGNGYINYTSNLASLHINNTELFYITESIKSMYKIFQYSNHDLFSQKELSFKPSYVAQHELESLLHSLGLKVQASKWLTLDKDSLESALEILLCDETMNESFADYDSSLITDTAAEAYYFEFNIYFNDLPLNDIKFYCPERYQLIPASKACVLITDDGLQYLNIYGAMSGESIISNVTPISAENAIQCVIDRQSNLIGAEPIVISDICLKYVAIKKNSDKLLFELIPAWQIHWYNANATGDLLIDAISGLEIV